MSGCGFETFGLRSRIDNRFGLTLNWRTGAGRRADGAYALSRKVDVRPAL